MEHDNHALLHGLAVSVKHIEESLNEIKAELRSIQRFQTEVEKYIAVEKARDEMRKKEARKISLFISAIISSLVNFISRFLQ